MRRSGLILAIFVLSGAAGLVYEVVWSRQLVLVFGNTTQAVSTILTGFFGGMAIGSFLGGRLADRVRSPLRLYGAARAGPRRRRDPHAVTFRLLHEVYRGAFAGLETQPALLALVRFGLALLALAPGHDPDGRDPADADPLPVGRPTTCRAPSRRLYAANTFGAILGTVAAGFFLIELLGLTGTLLVGATCSAIAGVAALVLDRRRAAAEAEIGARPAPEPARGPSTPVGSTAAAAPRSRPSGRARELALLVAFVSGLTSLGYQVLWIRLLASGTGNSTYVFTLDPRDLPDRPRPRRGGLRDPPAADHAARSCPGRRPGRRRADRHRAASSRSSASPATLDPSKALGDPLGDPPAGRPRRPAGHVRHGPELPGLSSLLADDPRQIATYAGRLLAANTLGAIVGTFVDPVLPDPARSARRPSVGVLALVNLGLGRRPGRSRDRTESRRPRSRPALVAAVLAVGDPRQPRVAGTTRFVDPNVARIQRDARHDLRSRRGRDRLRPGRASTMRQAAVGHRHVDDPPDRRREADADPAADAPAGVDQRR